MKAVFIGENEISVTGFYVLEKGTKGYLGDCGCPECVVCSLDGHKHYAFKPEGCDYFMDVWANEVIEY